MNQLNHKPKSVAVIGGGAAGFFGAINVALKNSNCDVVLYEASQRVLTKVLVSGGGRCNVTNNLSNIRDLSTKYPRGGKELIGPFNNFSTIQTQEWFERNGVRLKVEPDQRVFPVSDRSQEIVDCLVSKASRLKVKVRTGLKVKKVERDDENFILRDNKGEAKTFSKILLATGGGIHGFELAKSLGHKIVEPVPSLFTFEIKDLMLQGLSGVSFKKCKITLKIKEKKIENFGPVLVTHWGLSGPGVIVLSSIAARELNEVNYQTRVTVNFLPEFNQSSLNSFLMQCKMSLSKRKLITNNPLEIANSVWEKLITLQDISPDLLWADVSKVHLTKITRELIEKEFNLTGKGKFKEEFVTCGGVALNEVDFRTMESKICPGLYFAGEVLDVDGVTGGFNFQAAWTTSWIASQNM